MPDQPHYDTYVEKRLQKIARSALLSPPTKNVGLLLPRNTINSNDTPAVDEEVISTKGEKIQQEPLKEERVDAGISAKGGTGRDIANSKKKNTKSQEEKGNIEYIFSIFLMLF